MITNLNIKNVFKAFFVFSVFSLIAKARPSEHLYMDLTCNSNFEPFITVKLRNTRPEDLNLGMRSVGADIPTSLVSFIYVKTELDKISDGSWMEPKNSESDIKLLFIKNSGSNVSRNNKVLKSGESIEFTLDLANYIKLQEGVYYSFTYSYPMSSFFFRKGVERFGNKV